jgi:hypothetical protein
MRAGMSVPQRLLDRSVLVPFCGCRLWEGHVNVRTGYGEIKVAGKIEYTHRAAYRAFKGEPGPLHVLHSCDVRSCINPDHLFLGTNADNIADSMSKGRRKGVPRNRPHGLTYASRPGAHDIKLKVPRSEWPAIMVRLDAGESQKRVAADYSVNPTTIFNIKRRSLCA